MFVSPLSMLSGCTTSIVHMVTMGPTVAVSYVLHSGKLLIQRQPASAVLCWLWLRQQVESIVAWCLSASTTYHPLIALYVQLVGCC